jgi:HEPN domain-containing protein
MSTAPDYTKLAAEWFVKAQDDARTIQAIIKEKASPDTACFHAQQMAEKYFKGYLISKGQEVPKVHDLKYLVKLCGKFESNFTELQSDSALLSIYYIGTRYPGDIPEGFTWDEAKEAFEAATKIQDFVMKRI